MAAQPPLSIPTFCTRLFCKNKNLSMWSLLTVQLAATCFMVGKTQKTNTWSNKAHAPRRQWMLHSDVQSLSVQLRAIIITFSSGAFDCEQSRQQSRCAVTRVHFWHMQQHIVFARHVKRANSNSVIVALSIWEHQKAQREKQPLQRQERGRS